MVRTHKDLDVWKKGVAFVTEIYSVTNAFPKLELYGLISQIRRAAISIPSNIAEGATRRNNKEFLQFLYISLSSAAEVDTQLIISHNLKFIDDENLKQLQGELNIISKMIQGLIRSIKKKTKSI